MAAAANRKVGFLDAQLEAMSSRDRKLLAALLVFLALGFVVVWSWLLGGLLESRASYVRTNKEALEDALVLQLDHRDASARLKAAEERLGTFQGRSLATFLEELATKHSLTTNLSGVNELDATEVGSIKQTRYKVEFKRVPYGAAIALLTELETSGFPLRIHSAQLKKYNGKEYKGLDMNFEIVVYTLTGGS